MSVVVPPSSPPSAGAADSVASPPGLLSVDDDAGTASDEERLLDALFINFGEAVFVGDPSHVGGDAPPGQQDKQAAPGHHCDGSEACHDPSDVNDASSGGESGDAGDAGDGDGDDDDGGGDDDGDNNYNADRGGGGGGGVFAAVSSNVDMKDWHRHFTEKYSSCFNVNLTSAPPHRNTLFDEVEQDTPALSSCPPARMSAVEADAVQKHIDEMAAAGLLVPWHGMAKCRIFPVPKKTPPGEPQQYRCVLDGRPVNARVVPMPYTGPTSREQLIKLLRFRRMCKFDLTKAFFQVRVPKHAVGRYTFAGPDGRRWALTVATMGGTNSMVALLNMVSDIFADFIQEGCLVVYADDLILGTTCDSDEEMAALVERFLQRCREFHLIINPTKSEFMKTEVEFLGYRVGNGMVTPLVNHVDDLLKMAAPKDKQAVRRFLGLVNFYSWMCPSAHALAAPLNALTGDAPFAWGDAEQLAFDGIKKEIAGITAMALPALDGTPFVISVDASNVGLGGVLQQERDGKLMPLSFYSRPLTAEEQTWHVHETEMLAAVEMMRRHESWLRSGRHVEIRTDHKSLVYLQTTSPVKGRFLRWLDVLQAFPIRWRYIPGEENQADWLSRDDGFKPATKNEKEARWRDYFHRAQLAARQGGPSLPPRHDPHYDPALRHDADDYPISIMGLSAAALESATDVVVAALSASAAGAVKALPPENIILACKAGYEGDPVFGPIVSELRGGGQRESFYLNGGLLFRSSVLYGPQLCVPVGEALNKLLRAAHDSNSHTGVNKTISALKRFFFPCMHKTVSDYVTKCVTCARTKHDNQPPAGLLLPLPTPGGAWQHITIDAVGGLPPSGSQGYTYILTVVDSYTKSVRAFPMKDDFTAETVADLLISGVLAYTGPVLSIHSDRGPQFTSDVFHRMFQALGTDLSHTTAYHPQADGQTEVRNKHLVQALRAAIADGAGDAEWTELLPFVVWTLNSTTHASLGISPFEADYARQPVQAWDIANAEVMGNSAADSASPVPPSSDWRAAIDLVVHQALDQAKATYKRYADEKRRPPPVYKMGDRVLVSRQALSSGADRDLVHRTGRKLGPRFVGPYKITRVLRNACELDLPNSMRAHRVINVSYLRPYRPDGSFGRPDEPPPLIIDGEQYFQPQVIKAYDHKKVAGRMQHLYWVKWVGYTDSSNRWLPVQDLHLCKELVTDFWAARGETPPRGALPK